MAEEKLNTEEAVALTMLGDVVVDNPEAVKEILAQHGEEATGNPEIDFLKILALTEERGRYFTEDFEKMAAKEFKYFGTGLALTVASKLGDKLKDKIKDKIEKRREEGKGGKIKDLLKKVFGKKEDGTSKTPQEIADDEDAQKLARLGGGGGDENTPESDKPKPKPILGMHPALFFSILTIIILVIIFLIIRGMRKKTKKKDGEAK